MRRVRGSMTPVPKSYTVISGMNEILLGSDCAHRLHAAAVATTGFGCSLFLSVSARSILATSYSRHTQAIISPLAGGACSGRSPVWEPHERMTRLRRPSRTSSGTKRSGCSDIWLPYRRDARGKNMLDVAVTCDGEKINDEENWLRIDTPVRPVLHRRPVDYEHRFDAASLDTKRHVAL